MGDINLASGHATMNEGRWTYNMVLQRQDAASLHVVGLAFTQTDAREYPARRGVEVARIADAATGENAVRERAEDSSGGVHDDFFEEENDGIGGGY